LANYDRAVWADPQHVSPWFSRSLLLLLRGNYAETAGAILALNLVITIDTAVAHLAGALDRPAWVMLPFSPDWRWMLGSADSPWYPSLHLYHQPAPGDWASVIATIGKALAGHR
jgi:ADP-heptose:LPS heptosyltransferase